VHPLPYGKTVTIVRPGPPTRDAYGNDVPGPPVEITVEGGAVAPLDGNSSGANELVQARDTVISGLTWWPPAGMEVRPTDQARIDGLLYQVVGRPGSFTSPFTGSTGPAVVQLEYVTG
jgi:hypothetical protein